MTLALVAALVALAPGHARAQAGERCEAERRERADAHYESAFAALNEGLGAPEGSRARLGHFVRAKQSFESAFDACPYARYAFALAAALRQFGEYRASLSLFSRLVRGELPGELLPEQQASLASVVEELRARVAELRVRVRGAASATLRVDGSPVGAIRSSETRSLVVNPGRHLVDALAPGLVRAERTIAIESGERRNILLTLVPPRDERSAFERPWLWIGIGAVVAAAVAVGLALSIEQPLTDSPLGIVEI